jgi:hypothetical protein
MPEFRGWGGAALVTGASSGIGLELARALAARGMNLVLVSRSAENLRILAEQLSSAHKILAIPMPADLATTDGPSDLMNRLRGVDLTIDALVNNAGVGIYGAFGNQGPAREAEMLRLNVCAPTELAAYFLPGMIRRRRGLVLNVSSTAGFAPVPWLGSYGASKSYLIHWTHALDEELRGTGVRASVLCPGTTATNFVNVSGAKARARPFPEMTAVDVAEQCLRGVDRGKRVIVPGPLNAAHGIAGRLVPPSLAARIAGIVNRPAKPSR